MSLSLIAPAASCGSHTSARGGTSFPQPGERLAVGGGAASGEFERFVGAVPQPGELVEHLVFDPTDHRRPAVAEGEDAVLDNRAGTRRP